MLNNIKSVLKGYAELATHVLTIITLLGAVGGFLTYILNIITSPSVDYVFAVEKKLNPVKKDVNELETAADAIVVDMVLKKKSEEVGKKKFDEEEFKKEYEEFKKMYIPWMTLALTGREINADQVRVWILNLTDHPLNKVNVIFQQCTGHVQHEAEPISQLPEEGKSQNLTSLTNGVMYRYGDIKKDAGVYLKFGFKDIQNCSVIVESVNADGSIPKGKMVTSDEYNEFYNQRPISRSVYFRYIIPFLCFSVVIVIIAVVITYNKISTRIKAIEQKNH